MQTKGVFVCFLNDGIGPVTCHVMRSAVINDVKHIMLKSALSDSLTSHHALYEVVRTQNKMHGFRLTPHKHVKNDWMGVNSTHTVFDRRKPRLLCLMSEAGAHFLLGRKSP